MRLITDRLPALVAYVDASQRYGFVNAYYEQAIGVSTDKAFGRHIQEVLGDEAYTIVRPNIERVLSGELVRCAIELPVPDGKKSFRVSYIPDMEDDGSVSGFVLLALDVTEEKRLQERLEQSQRLEAVGQLSGGIAHDFNNLLGVIVGNLDLAMSRVDGEVRRYLEAALLASERGTSLTHRLLAFARRQTLNPAVIDPNAVIRSMEDMLVRTLGRQIEVKIVPNDAVWSAVVDAHQLESAILNLAINARDAMPAGGKLTIETQNNHLEAGPAADAADLLPGDYVVISVTDNGSGMGPETLAHVFEPFYTTKEFGKGSGLGMAMVYGFAKQSEGGVTIYSEEGEGTTVRIYLPSSAEAANGAPPERAAEEPSLGGDGVAVLLVEDDPAVRAVVTGMLRQLNYRVVACEDGEQALACLEQEEIGVLLTDIVLQGGMSGDRLAEAAQQRIPGLAVLYMSGYAENAAAHHQRIDVGDALLEKPFRLVQLASALARVRGRS